MSLTCIERGALFAGAVLVAAFAATASARQSAYPKPTELPNPYRLVEGWPTLPASMNGGRWGEVIRVHVHRDGNVWVFHRCFNTVPRGQRHLHQSGQRESADSGIRSLRQASEEFRRGTVRLSARLHRRSRTGICG